MTRWKRWAVTIAAAVTCALQVTALAGAQSQRGSGGRLEVYFVDVEGGQATLFVTPAGRSLLIDTGWPDNDGRDADRITEIAKSAGLRRIDYVLITHFHEDHVGGVPQLLEKIPVGAVIDHGENRELQNPAVEKVYSAYLKVIAEKKIKRIIVKPGDVLPIVGMKATVVSADGAFIKSPLQGGGEENPFCKESEVRAPDETENSRSVGIQIVFGKLKLLDMGDLTWDKEMDMQCPINKLGHVDILIASHHGWYQSSSPALVYAVGPRVVVMDNGEKKGGSAATLETIEKSPKLETLWQLHYSDEGEALNTPEEYIANPQGVDGNYLRLTGGGDGSFEIFNSRSKTSRHYGVAQKGAP